MRGVQMNANYKENALLFKALSDPTRLEIVDMLSCGELCACKILERFDITQPTLSHHMKILCECSLVSGRKDGKWTYYSLHAASVAAFKDYLSAVTTCNEDCVCDKGACDCE
jgi:ArsR family transcriptional regulator